MVKYSGDNGLVKIRQMLHEIGVDATVIIMAETYSKNGSIITDES